jgi:hypothetical protein
MTPFTTSREKLTPEVLDELELGGQALDVHRAERAVGRTCIVFPEHHLPNPMGPMVDLPVGVTDWQEGLFLDAERLLLQYRINQLIIEATDTPTLFQVQRGEIRRSRDLRKLIKREKQRKISAGGQLNPIGEELLVIGLDPSLSLEARRARAEQLIGVVSVSNLIQAVYGPEKGLEIKGLEPVKMNKERGVIDGEMHTLLENIRKGRVTLGIRGVKLPILKVREMAATGDPDALRVYTYFREDYLLKQRVEPVVEIALKGCNTVVANRAMTLRGGSLMVYGSYHARDLVEKMSMHTNVGFRGALPERLIAQTAAYEGPDDFFHHDALIRRVDLYVPPVG